MYWSLVRVRGGGKREGQTEETQVVVEETSFCFPLWFRLRCHCGTAALITQLRERCDYSLSSDSFNYHSITLQMKKREWGEKKKKQRTEREQECQWKWGKSNWTRVIILILILQRLNMHQWDLIHGAANARSRSAGKCKCVLMYVQYNARAI